MTSIRKSMAPIKKAASSFNIRSSRGASLVRKPSSINTLDKLIADAKWHQAGGDHELAYNTWSKAVELNPRNAQLHYERGNALFALHSYTKALDCFYEALDVEAEHLDAMNSIGYCLCHLGKHWAAIGMFEKILNIDGDHTHALRGNNIAVTGLLGVRKVELAKELAFYSAQERKKLVYERLIEQERGSKPNVNQDGAVVPAASGQRIRRYTVKLRDLELRAKKLDKKQKETEERAAKVQKDKAKDMNEDDDGISNLEMIRKQIKQDRLQLQLERKRLKEALAKEQRRMHRARMVYDKKINEVKNELTYIKEAMEAFKIQIENENKESHSRSYQLAVQAVHSHNAHKLQKIIQRDSHIKYEKDVRQSTLLHLAAAENNMELIKTLLAAGDNTRMYASLKDVQGKTAANIAGNTAVGAVLNAREKQEQSAHEKINKALACRIYLHYKELETLHKKLMALRDTLGSVQLKHLDALYFSYRDGFYPVLQHTKTYKKKTPLITLDSYFHAIEYVKFRADRRRCDTKANTLGNVKIPRHVDLVIQPLQLLKELVQHKEKKHSEEIKESIKMIKKSLDSSHFLKIFGTNSIDNHIFSRFIKQPSQSKRAVQAIDELMNAANTTLGHLELERKFYVKMVWRMDTMAEIHEFSPERIAMLAKIAQDMDKKV